jgi:glycerophosphoryl diester phosphodiesterase
MIPGRIEIVGHGGAGDFFPGNSRGSIEKALELNVDRIEIDLIATASGELVLVHDHELRDADGARRKVRKLPTELVRERVDQMLTLDEFFAIVDPSRPVLLDLKKPGYERAVAEAVKLQAGRDIWISTTHARSIFALRSKLTGVTFGLSSGHIATGIPKSALRPLMVRIVRTLTPIPLLITARLCGARMIMVNFRACSPWLVHMAHAKGIRVAVWTANRPADILAMAEMEVDAIISNRPDLVREIVRH